MALMFLNGDGMRGGRAHYTIEGVPLVGERRTAALYRFYSVRDEFPALYPVAEGGQPVLGELYDVPMGPLSALLATEPPSSSSPSSNSKAVTCPSRWCCGTPNTSAASTRTSLVTAGGGPTRPLRSARSLIRDAPDPHASHVGRGSQGEDPGQRVSGVAGMLEVDRQRAAPERAQPDRIEVLADREVAYPVVQAQRPRAAARRQVQQVRRLSTGARPGPAAAG